MAKTQGDEALKEAVDYDEMRKELLPIFEKHGVTNVSFCGFHKDMFVGMFNIGGKPGLRALSEMFESAMAVGRLWQHARTAIRDNLNFFDKKGPWV